MGREDQAAGIEESLFAAARIMVNILAESLMRERSEYITVPQFRILDMIQNLTDKPTEIAQMLGVSPPAISSMLEKLEEKKMVRRSFSTSDRRRVQLALTEDGAKLVSRVNARRRASLDKVLRGMDGGARSGLEASLRDFNHNYLTSKEGFG